MALTITCRDSAGADLNTFTIAKDRWQAIVVNASVAGADLPIPDYINGLAVGDYAAANNPDVSGTPSVDVYLGTADGVLEGAKVAAFSAVITASSSLLTTYETAALAAIDDADTDSLYIR